MTFCLPKNIVDDFLGKLKKGEIDPEKLTDMTSQERHKYFAGFMGENNAGKVNALFESKLLLKNQQQGIINWAKQVSGIKPEVKRDLLSRVEKMTSILQPKEMDAFLGDLAAQRLGIGVTMEEAGKIADLAKTTADKKSAIPENSPIRSKERLEYGTTLTTFRDYVSNLKLEANKLTPKELLKDPGAILETVGGVTKSLVASMDNSFFGRQGFITLVNNPDVWLDGFLKSWGDMGKELQGIDAMLPIKADVYSRPNALNGKYKAMGIDIGIESEEAYPSQLPEKIPLLGRLFKASESAYNGAALRFRADLADRLISEAESMGVDVKDKEANLGNLINSMTGRGKVQLTPGQSKFINATVFSIRYLKSNLDMLSAPVKALGTIGKNIKEPGVMAKRKAAEAILKTIGVIAGILAVSKLLDPDSVELDPRSAKFGKIWVGNKNEIPINISLGMGAIVTLASRIIPTIHNGKAGGWIKNNKGQYVNWWDNKFGQSNGSDLIFNFMKGKASPIAGMLLNYLEARSRDYGKPTLGGTATTMTTPIAGQNLYQLSQTSAGEDLLLFTVLETLDLLGVNVNPQSKQKKGRKF
jgi:hypothetical protein